MWTTRPYSAIYYNQLQTLPRYQMWTTQPYSAIYYNRPIQPYSAIYYKQSNLTPLYTIT